MTDVAERTPDGDPAMHERLEAFARDALRAHGIGPDAALTLLNVSENATYAVDDLATGERSVLRVHRPGYHTRAAVESELAWIQALRAEHVVATPEVLGDRTPHRELVQRRTQSFKPAA